MKLLKSLKLLLGISAIKTSNFPNRLKLADIKLYIKIQGRQQRKVWTSHYSASNIKNI